MNGNYIRLRRSFNKLIYDKCFEFAKKVNPTNIVQYADRNQKNIPFMIQQTTAGKISELYDEHWGKFMGFQCTNQPDFNIYTAKGKGFISDLVFEGDKARKYFDLDKEKIYVSCKGSFYKMGGNTEYSDGEPIPVTLPKQYSWTYQFSNLSMMGGQDTYDHDVYIFNIVDFQQMTVGAYAWVKKEIVDKMFIRPYLQSKKGIKLVVQQTTCGGMREFPCGIDELLDENYEPKKPI